MGDLADQEAGSSFFEWGNYYQWVRITTYQESESLASDEN
jgi:hypothetical protein